MLYSDNCKEKHEVDISHSDKEPDIMLRKVENAIGRLKLKACGSDGITAQMIKRLGADGMKIFHAICKQIWVTGQWPEDWTESIIIPLHKKG